MSTPRRVGILIFEDVEVLDFCGPFEVFASALKPGMAEGPDVPRLFEVVLIAESRELVKAFGGLRVEPHVTIDDCPPLDLLLVPGGWGTRGLLANERLISWLREQAGAVELMTSVCTGASLLARAGLLDGKSATSHWGTIDWMREAYPAITMLDNRRVVDEGNIITSAGVSAGIDMALYLVGKLHGPETAAHIAHGMEYDWHPERLAAS